MSGDVHGRSGTFMECKSQCKSQDRVVWASLRVLIQCREV